MWEGPTTAPCRPERWVRPRTGLCRLGRWSPAWPPYCCCPEPSPAAAAAAAASPGTSGAWPRGQRSGLGSPVGEDRPMRERLPRLDSQRLPVSADLLLGPAGLGFQQGVQDPPQGGALLAVITADHVVGGAHTPEEERVQRGESGAPWQVDQVQVEDWTFSTITRRRGRSSPGT